MSGVMDPLDGLITAGIVHGSEMSFVFAVFIA